MAQFRHYVQRGMRVVGSDGGDVGSIEDIRADGLVVRGPTAGAVSIPYDTIQNVLGNEIVLNVPATQVVAPETINLAPSRAPKQAHR